MDLKEYREINRKYFHKDSFAISAEEDKDKVSDEAIIDFITKKHPEIGRTIIGFIAKDDYFLWHAVYPILSDDELIKTSEKVQNTIKSSIKGDINASLPVLEATLRENRNKIDYRRILLNTIVSLDGAMQYAKAEKQPQVNIDNMKIIKDRMVAQIKQFRPHVEDPEIYLVTPPLDPSKSAAELVCLNWDEIINGKKSKNIVDLGLTNGEIKTVESILSIEDTRLIPDSWECGRHVETYLALAIDKSGRDGNQIKASDGYKIVKEVLRIPEYQRVISPEKYHFLALYRALEFIESYTIASEKEFEKVEDKTGILLLAKKLKGLVEKDYSAGRGVDEPFTVFMDDNRVGSDYKYNSDLLIDGGIVGMIDQIGMVEIDKYYFGITRKYMKRLVENDLTNPMELYKMGLLTSVEFKGYIQEADERNYVSLLNKAYDKQILDENTIKALLERAGNNKERLRRIGVAEIRFIMPRVQSSVYKNNVVLDEMFLSGIVNQDLLIAQYFNGMLKIEDLNSFARYVENSEAIKDQVDCSKIKFNPETLAKMYMQLNLKGIINSLANKEHFDKETISEILKEHPELIRNCTPEQMKEFQKTYILQKNLLNSLSEKEQRQFMDALGLIGEAKGIAFDLYKKGLISKHVAEQYGGSEFIKQYQKTQLVDGLRFNDLLSIKNLISAYNHGRISLSKILRKYAEGEMSPEIYYAFKENRDMADAFDKDYLFGLYDKCMKTGKAADMEILERYYKEAKLIVRDKKILEEINKKQLELISSKKNNKFNIVTMARNGVIDKGNIAMMDVETIAQLIMSGNTLNRDTAKELFRDTDGTTAKRDRLEELFRRGLLTQDEMFTILTNVYVGNQDCSPEQKEIDANNMDYFLDQNYFEAEYNEMVERSEPTRHNKKGVGTVKNEQQRFPIKERIEFLYSLDEKESINYKAGPALIIQLPGKNKVIIETLGTPGKDSAGTMSDLTNHCTYIVSRNTFESIKPDIFEEKVAMTKTRRKEIESVLMYSKLIEMYNNYGKAIGMRRFRHNKYWESSLLKYFEEPEVKEQKEIKREDKDIDD